MRSTILRPPRARRAEAKSSRPADMPWLAPFLPVRDARSSLRFYEAAFGFLPAATELGPDGAVVLASMTWRDAVIRFGAGEPTATPATLYVYCDDADALYARAIAAGACRAFAPMDAPWGDRLCKLVDPDGHAWNFATHRAGTDAGRAR